MHINVPTEVAAFVQARIASYSTEAPPELQWASPFVAEFGALPLYFGWTEIIALRPHGGLVCWSTEAQHAGLQSLQDRSWVLPALVAGANRYPQLRVLLPERPPGAVDCPCLKHPLLASNQVLCGNCGGLGWLATEGRA